MTENDDLKRLRRNTRAEAAATLNIPHLAEGLGDRWSDATSAQRQARPPATGRVVHLRRHLEIGRLLPSLMTGRQANSRAEGSIAPVAVNEANVAMSVATEVSDEDLACFLNLRSAR